jgi:hypothetical protein
VGQGEKEQGAGSREQGEGRKGAGSSEKFVERSCRGDILSDKLPCGNAKSERGKVSFLQSLAGRKPTPPRHLLQRGGTFSEAAAPEKLPWEPPQRSGSTLRFHKTFQGREQGETPPDSCLTAAIFAPFQCFYIQSIFLALSANLASCCPR